MFNSEFYPTPPDVADRMLSYVNVRDRVVLEPSAGKGDLAHACRLRGAAEVIVCERDQTLKRTLSGVFPFLADDFLTVTADQVSHVGAVVMNPPFSVAVQHIKHAWDIAPPGAQIVALCNASLLDWRRFNNRDAALLELIKNHGCSENIGSAFGSGSEAERHTDVEIGLVNLLKPGGAGETDYDGFFMGPDDVEAEGDGLITYSLARDVVNRYVGACKIYDRQLQAGVEMKDMLGGLYGERVGFQATVNGMPTLRNTFQKELQKSAWMYVFDKMNMQKMATQKLKADINKFVESQYKVPFTMRNIYTMVEMVQGTHVQRMNTAIEEAFDALTKHHTDNRHNVEGWAHNSQYLFSKYFILDGFVEKPWGNDRTVRLSYSHHTQYQLEDLIKALCHVTGRKYEDVSEPPNRNSLETGVWMDWGFFEFKVFKKGTGHFKFKSLEDWKLLNLRIAEIKGYTLPERL
jgi:hypothetical protein